VNDFNIYQRLFLIFVAVSVIVDFCPEVFYTVRTASHLKGVVVNLASPGVSQVTNVCVQKTPVCTDIFKSYTTIT